MLIIFTIYQLSVIVITLLGVKNARPTKSSLDYRYPNVAVRDAVLRKAIQSDLLPTATSTRK